MFCGVEHDVDCQNAFVDMESDRIHLEFYWKSTGFCPPLPHEEICDWIKSSSFVTNLAWIAAIPNNGIRFIRVHWLLDSVFVRSNNISGIVYDFSCLDFYLGLLHQHEMFPIFEIMGNPSSFFDDFENKTQILIWEDFVYQLASRYEEMFGINSIRNWFFETWNEPKPSHFDSLKISPQGFLNYYDATASGLKRAHPELRIGVPGGACSERFQLENYCWLLLDHINRGKSFLDDLPVIQPDFLSIHKKGVYPNSSRMILDGETNFIMELDNHLTAFDNTPIYNDEGDPEVSWNVSRTWQADVSYASIIAKVIHDHLYSQKYSIKRMKFLSNDNAFLTYHPFPFTQRTQLARFQVNTTIPPHIQFIRKPSYIVMGLLSLLGDQVIRTEHRKSNLTSRVEPNSICDTIATMHEGGAGQEWFLSIMIINTQFEVRNRLLNCTVYVSNIPHKIYKDLMYVIHYMDNSLTNPFKIWNDSGCHQTPSTDIFQKMRFYEEPLILDGPTKWNKGSYGYISLIMEPISIALLHFCSHKKSLPGKVTGVFVSNITFNQVFITWSDSNVGSRCILTYEVEHSVDDQHYRRINLRSTIFNSFVYAPTNYYNIKPEAEETVGYYRVRAVNFWNVPGEFSVPFKFTQNNFT